MPEDELTIETLDKAIALIKEAKQEDEIVGFSINPSDLRKIKDATAYLYGMDEIKFFVIPPYAGIALYSDINTPIGHPIPLRRKDLAPTKKEVEK